MQLNNIFDPCLVESLASEPVHTSKEISLFFTEEQKLEVSCACLSVLLLTATYCIWPAGETVPPSNKVILNLVTTACAAVHCYMHFIHFGLIPSDHGASSIVLVLPTW